MSTLQVRWLGRVAYADADAVQRAYEQAADDYLLLLEHPHVYTLGVRATFDHVLVPPGDVGATLERVDRGGDVTYHGPGQLVGYPIVTLPEFRPGLRDVVRYVRNLEAVLVDALDDLGVKAGVDPGYTGVWVDGEKIAAIGVRVARGRTRHGFALNVDPDLSMFSHIVPCGIRDRGVTSLARLLGEPPAFETVVDRVAARFADRFGYDESTRADVTPHASRTPVVIGATPGAVAGVAGRDAASQADPVTPPRPPWMRVRADLGPGYRETKRLMRSLDLHTVCEEAGCPNIYECWADGTATFMILGDRCTRACGFCLVDTRRPLPVDPDEPVRVGAAVAKLRLEHVVVTSVARDDLPDGGAAGFADTIAAIRRQGARTRVEVLIPDCRGDARSLDVIFGARPDILNHNLETVARLQHVARPSASYARSLAVLARAKTAGLTTKSGLIVGMGETADELRVAIRDLANVGVDVLTIGQYLQPSPAHLPVVRWWTPDELASLAAFAEPLGFAHVEAGPLVRSSYHAKRAAQHAAEATVGVLTAGAPR